MGAAGRLGVVASHGGGACECTGGAGGTTSVCHPPETLARHSNGTATRRYM